MDDVPATEVRDDNPVTALEATKGTASRRRIELPMAPNLIGLGLVVAAVIFLIAAALWSGVVLWILGVICLIGGVGALWLTWQRKRRATL